MMVVQQQLHDKWLATVTDVKTDEHADACWRLLKRINRGPATDYCKGVVRRSLDRQTGQAKPALAPSTFGERLLAARKSQGMTQQDVADELECSKGSVCQWENDVYSPRPQARRDLESVLGV